MFANAREFLDHAIIVPFGEMFGFPVEETVATKPSFWISKNALILGVIGDKVICLKNHEEL